MSNTTERITTMTDDTTPTIIRLVKEAEANALRQLEAQLEVVRRLEGQELEARAAPHDSGSAVVLARIEIELRAARALAQVAERRYIDYGYLLEDVEADYANDVAPI